jgi:hypothetical protein
MFKKILVLSLFFLTFSAHADYPARWYDVEADYLSTADLASFASAYCSDRGGVDIINEHPSERIGSWDCFDGSHSGMSRGCIDPADQVTITTNTDNMYLDGVTLMCIGSLPDGYDDPSGGGEQCNDSQALVVFGLTAGTCHGGCEYAINAEHGNHATSLIGTGQSCSDSQSDVESGAGIIIADDPANETGTYMDESQPEPETIFVPIPTENYPDSPAPGDATVIEHTDGITTWGIYADHITENGVTTHYVHDEQIRRTQTTGMTITYADGTSKYIETTKTDYTPGALYSYSINYSSPTSPPTITDSVIQSPSTSTTTTRTITYDASGAVVSDDSSTATGTTSGGTTAGDGTGIGIDETGTPTGNDNMFDGKLDGTGFDDLITGLGGTTPDDPQFDNPFDLPDAGCQSVSMTVQGHTVSFPDSASCAKMGKMKEIFGYAFYIMTAVAIIFIAFRPS